MADQKIRALVVDDERLARKDLSNMLNEIEGVEIIGEAEDVPSAIKAIESLHPDIVFLDIQMPGQTGFDLVEKVDFSGKIVFVTAYDEYAIEAFDAQAVGYLLKPVRREKLERALQQAGRLGASQLGELASADTRVARREHIAIRVRDELRLISIKDVRFFRADQKYVTVYHAAGENLIDESMKLLAEEFEPDFVRIDRGILVSLVAIEALERDAQGKHRVRLRGTADTLPVSRRRLAALKHAMLARKYQ